MAALQVLRPHSVGAFLHVMTQSQPRPPIACAGVLRTHNTRPRAHACTSHAACVVALTDLLSSTFCITTPCALPAYLSLLGAPRKRAWLLLRYCTFLCPARARPLAACCRTRSMLSADGGCGPTAALCAGAHTHPLADFPSGHYCMGHSYGVFEGQVAGRKPLPLLPPAQPHHRGVFWLAESAPRRAACGPGSWNGRATLGPRGDNARTAHHA